MKIQDKTRMVRKAACTLALSAMMLAGVARIAVAQGSSGSIDFCNTTDYQNTTLPTLQSSGLFTDVARYGGPAGSPAYRPDQINRNSGVSPCVLNFTGANNNNIVEMWITLLGTPGTTPPTNSCWNLKGNFQHTSFNNNKAIGFVTNYNTSTHKGLFFGMYDAGNTDSMALITFDASSSFPGTIPTATVGSSVSLAGQVALGSWYALQLDICSGTITADGSGPVYVSATGSWQPANSPNPTGTCPLDKAADQKCLQFQGLLPAGISTSGAAGLAALSTGNSSVNSNVTKFTFVRSEPNPD